MNQIHPVRLPGRREHLVSHNPASAQPITERVGHAYATTCVAAAPPARRAAARADGSAQADGETDAAAT